MNNYCYNGRDIGVEIESIRESVAEIKSTLGSISGIKFGDKVQKTNINTDNGLTNKLNFIIEQEKKLETLIGLQINLMKKIDRLASPKARAIFRYRFINGYSYELIAEKIGISRNQVHRIYSNYISKFRD